MIGESSELRYRSRDIAQSRTWPLQRRWWLARSCGTSEPRRRARRGAAGLDLCAAYRASSDRLQDEVRRRRWMADPTGLRRICEERRGRCSPMPAPRHRNALSRTRQPSCWTGIVHALDGLALLVEAPGRPRSQSPRLPSDRPGLAACSSQCGTGIHHDQRGRDLLGRYRLADRCFRPVVVAILLLLLGSKGDLAYAGASPPFIGCVGSVVYCAAIIKFAALPAVETFPAFCLAIGVFYLPVGFVIARSRKPAVLAIFSVMALTFMPLLAPTNPMRYDTVQFYNFALAVFIGCGAAGFHFTSCLRSADAARRLLDLRPRDLRRSPSPLCRRRNSSGKSACSAGSPHYRTRRALRAHDSWPCCRVGSALSNSRGGATTCAEARARRTRSPRWREGRTAPWRGYVLVISSAASPRRLTKRRATIWLCGRAQTSWQSQRRLLNIPLSLIPE